VFTRLLSTPLDNQDVGNWACMLGIAALFVEGVLVALSAHAMSLSPRSYPRASGATTHVLVPKSARALVRVESTNGSRSLTPR
jgi:hypothetical protein